MAKEPTIWTLDQRSARLQLAGLSGIIDLLKPGQGLHQIVARKTQLAEFEILQVKVPENPQAEGNYPAEAYVRGPDLIATYEQSDTRPVRSQVYWQARDSRAKGLLATLELVLSVQTSLWDSDPQLAVGSIVPAAESLRLLDSASDRFETLSIPPARGSFSTSPEGFSSGCVRAQPLTMESSTGPGCFIFRPHSSQISYVEMVHPSDYRTSELTATIPDHAVPENETSPASRHAIELRHRLFIQRLEKGVILRARIRGAFLDRHSDTMAAAELFREFAAADPPLTA